MNLSNLFGIRRRPRPPRPETIISRHIGKAIGGLIIAGGAALFGLNSKNLTSKNSSPSFFSKTTQNDQKYVAQKDSINANLIAAINQKTELPFVEIKSAKVVKLLRNDNSGARHQRWIISIDNGVLISVSHNIDLTDKIPLSLGDEIDLAGELVFGDKKNDPIIHWTHADPQKKRMAGYVVHNGKKYGDLKN